jgi:Methyltransferase domain
MPPASTLGRSAEDLEVKMVRNIPEIISNELRQTIKGIQGRALYQSVWYLFEHLVPTQLACLYLFTIGPFRKKYRALIYTIWKLVCPQVFTKRYVPSVAITSLVSNAASLHLCEQAEDVGNISLAELFVLVELLRTCQPTTCFEIGTYDGRTALNMAANTPEDAVIYTLDLPRDQIGSTLFPLNPADLGVVKKETSGARYRGTEWEYKIQQLYGDSAAFDYTPYQGNIDFVFVDGSHTYDYVLSDSRQAMTLLRNGQGIILWHDYPTTSAVQKAINYLQATDSRFAGIRYIKDTRFAVLICR